LARAFRCGKLSLAALEATLKLFLSPELLRARHPIYRMLGLTPDDLARRAKKVAAALRKTLPDGVGVSVEDGESQVGSGAVPVETIPTKVLAVASSSISPDDLALKLRRLDPPVFARISRNAVLLDFRTIQPGEDAIVERSIAAVFNKEGQSPPEGKVPSPAS
jgi:L-seryl-tRNA(Ser) seleniumtransferase